MISSEVVTDRQACEQGSHNCKPNTQQGKTHGEDEIFTSEGALDAGVFAQVYAMLDAVELDLSIGVDGLLAAGPMPWHGEGVPALQNWTSGAWSDSDTAATPADTANLVSTPAVKAGSGELGKGVETTETRKDVAHIMGHLRQCTRLVDFLIVHGCFA